MLGGLGAFLLPGGMLTSLSDTGQPECPYSPSRPQKGKEKVLTA
jgi:hypothetical protein